jgi:hypothetical protein
MDDDCYVVLGNNFRVDFQPGASREIGCRRASVGAEVSLRISADFVTICVIAENRLLPITPIQHMINRSGELDSALCEALVDSG